MKKIFLLIITLVLFLIVLLVLYPHIEFVKNGRIYSFYYGNNINEWEDNMCYDESYSYNEKRDISVSSWEFKKFLFFKLVIMDFEIGNVCDFEYHISLKDFNRIINESKIIENSHNINLKKLISNKIEIVGNHRYSLDNYDNYLVYELDNQYKEMYISNVEDLLVIQIGLSDEGPKYIAFMEKPNYSKISFINKTWARKINNETEYISFTKEGVMSYSCDCKKHGIDSSLYKNYQYNEKSKKIQLIPSQKNTFKYIDVISYTNNELRLKIDGDLRIFNSN